jgi:alcohol dehydrogenase (cytochrome c)
MKQNRIVGLSLLLAMMTVLVEQDPAQVTASRIAGGAREPQNWLTYSGNYRGWRYSPLDQINTTNVNKLSVQWVFQTDGSGKFETTPLVVDGVMYITAQDDRGYAVDARTGRVIWLYRRSLPDKMRICCGHVNRGFGAGGDKVFMATLDAHVVALDSKTGNVVWDVEAEDYRKGYSFTLAPLVVKDKVIVGVSGGEYGIRGFIDAYDADTGKRAWRFYTIPGRGESGNDSWAAESWKTGGAPAWVTGSYDPELNLVYWGTGNPAPSNYGGGRKGDNLYSNCLVALDADTGKLKWHFQFTPFDLHDWDATEVPVLIDFDLRGQKRTALVQANRNGFFYALDRTDGAFLFASPLTRVTWAKGIGPDGRPILAGPGEAPPEGSYVCPGAIGATNWMSPSYSPQTGLFYVAVRDQCDRFTSAPQPYREGHTYIGSSYVPATGEKDRGALRALDPRTGEMKWEFKYYSAPWGGALSTAGGLVLAGDMEGNFSAFDARTGANLWHLQTGSAIWTSPMSYSVDGKQIVVIASGSALFALGLNPGGSPSRRDGRE